MLRLVVRVRRKHLAPLDRRLKAAWPALCPKMFNIGEVMDA